jgi:MoaA/NifB/PqqE/SkfB family radical SAM enzyme
MGFDELAVTMTPHSKYIDELKETMDLAETLGATTFYLNRLIPAGRGIDAHDLDVAPQEKVDALGVLYRRFYRSVIEGSGMQGSKGSIFTVNEALSGYEKMF